MQDGGKHQVSCSHVSESSRSWPVRNRPVASISGRSEEWPSPLKAVTRVLPYQLRIYSGQEAPMTSTRLNAAPGKNSGTFWEADTEEM